MLRRAFLVSLVGVLCSYSGGDSARAAETSPGDPVIKKVAALAVPPRKGVAFKNLDPAYKRASYFARLHSFIVGGTWLVPERRVSALPAAVPDLQALRDNHHEATVTWIGHSTLLVQLDGVNFLTDPTWAGRSGPFSGLVGVRRYTPAPMRMEDLRHRWARLRDHDPCSIHALRP